MGTQFGDGTDPAVGKNTQFKPGQSGNPTGNPKGYIHTRTMLREFAEGEIDWTKDVPIRGAEKMAERYGNRAMRAVIAVAFAKAMEGDAAARRWITETLYGKSLDVTSDNKPLPTPIYAGDSLKTVGKKDTVNGLNNDNTKDD